jgi:hypothetical protein
MIRTRFSSAAAAFSESLALQPSAEVESLLAQTLEQIKEEEKQAAEEAVSKAAEKELAEQRERDERARQMEAAKRKEMEEVARQEQLEREKRAAEHARAEEQRILAERERALREREEKERMENEAALERRRQQEQAERKKKEEAERAKKLKEEAERKRKEEAQSEVKNKEDKERVAKKKDSASKKDKDGSAGKDGGKKAQAESKGMQEMATPVNSKRNDAVPVRADAVEDTVERFKRAEALKEAGNDLFRKGCYVEAKAKYLHALDSFVKVVAREDAPECCRAMLIACHLNVSACALKTGNEDGISDALLHSSAALRMDPYNVKALYRRGHARYLEGDLAGAAEDLYKAAELSPGDPAVINLFKEVESKQATLRASRKGPALRAGHDDRRMETATKLATDTSKSPVSQKLDTPRASAEGKQKPSGEAAAAAVKRHGCSQKQAADARKADEEEKRKLDSAQKAGEKKQTSEKSRADAQEKGKSNGSTVAENEAKAPESLDRATAAATATATATAGHNHADKAAHVPVKALELVSGSLHVLMRLLRRQYVVPFRKPVCCVILRMRLWFP